MWEQLYSVLVDFQGVVWKVLFYEPARLGLLLLIDSNINMHPCTKNRSLFRFRAFPTC